MASKFGITLFRADSKHHLFQFQNHLRKWSFICSYFTNLKPQVKFCSWNLRSSCQQTSLPQPFVAPRCASEQFAKGTRRSCNLRVFTKDLGMIFAIFFGPKASNCWVPLPHLPTSCWKREWLAWKLQHSHRPQQTHFFLADQLTTSLEVHSKWRNCYLGQKLKNSPTWIVWPPYSTIVSDGVTMSYQGHCALFRSM